MTQQLIRLSVKGISLSQIQSGIYVLFLEEESGKMKLPILIDGMQAQSIAFALGHFENDHKNRNLSSLSRSFTHDLFITFTKAFFINLKSVVIYKLLNGIFFSYIVCENYKNQKSDVNKQENHENDNIICNKIDSKTSDAVALAIRFQAPIYTTKEIFNKAGIYVEKNPLTENEYAENIIENSIPIYFKKERNKQTLESMTEKDLHLLLNQAVINEYYELAAKIKKELDKR
ncbi:bifunctional nuclease family protein [Blattabacterium cuenoti]|uniref:bifunctional nuclease family protein n=1 Tax=Blattabacterium cuenoti TaxID=1653831 RepID=UPI00163C6C15|nr:bifunctional nuclease family protein [Blattabacterium cuenoti]